ncbi:hypothetical protein OVA29_19475 [Exiguobacterium sp. SL14]|nr:hypothetical protein [Exiguobacterium sp. SL14]MCY1692453.1 hypothetical protein [Exiguobacterium sp. SL14]
MYQIFVSELNRKTGTSLRLNNASVVWRRRWNQSFHRFRARSSNWNGSRQSLPVSHGIVFPEYVERTATLTDWTLALETLVKLTPYSTSEFAVRRFLLADQERYLEQALIWTTSDDEHVRRLASEGTRPRLPWGQAIPSLIADPRPRYRFLMRYYRIRLSTSEKVSPIT